ncbi:DUF262 domain-containing protein [Desulfobacterales bacterium HSG2]|nr:DUF262 domain-containing protein [Desulfobacterales bacterium HSG2]
MALFPDERLTRHEEVTDSMSDEDINLKYMKGDIRIVTMNERYPLKRVATMLEKGDYELQPEFRRRHRWNNRKKSLLTESFLINVPVPPVFLYEDRPSHYEVIDGFQRLKAVYDLFRDKLVLEGLEKWPELNGRRYSQLPDRIKTALIRRNLSSFILLPGKAAKNGDESQFRQMIFERMNTGGSRITHQESRSFIPRGRAVTHHEETTDWTSDEDINLKYVKDEFIIVTELARYPLKKIVTMLDSGDYELQPEFRRRHRWYNYKKSKLIESFIMNVPIPPIFLYEDRISHYEVMDGPQRLTAIYEFYTDKLVLEGLEKWPELNGYRYSQLPDQIRQGIDRQYLSAIILLYETPKDEEETLKFKQMVFERINSGGTSLTPQENRNAILRGPLNDLCCKLSRNKYLCKTWDIPETDDEELLIENKHYQRMEDVELVLRFFANRQRRELMHPGESLKHYLDEFLRHGNQEFSQEVLRKLEDLFNRTIRLIYDIFGKRAFWLMRPRSDGLVWWREATMTVYDPMMYVFSQHVENRKRILDSHEKIQYGLEELYRTNYHEFKCIHQDDIDRQIALFEDFIASIIG